MRSYSWAWRSGCMGIMLLCTIPVAADTMAEPQVPGCRFTLQRSDPTLVTGSGIVREVWVVTCHQPTVATQSRLSGGGTPVTRTNGFSQAR